MTDSEKLSRLIQEADELIGQGTTEEGTQFISWKNKAELFVNRKYGDDSLEYKKFTKISYDTIDWSAINGFSPTVNHIGECKKGLQIAKGMLQNFSDDLSDESNVPVLKSDNQESLTLSHFQKIFIVHGHNGELKESVARIIEKQGIEAIILSEKANIGRTIIEKFEDYSDVGGAVCLFTADDLGNVNAASEFNPRARQNVVFEAGYFIGKLGREHIAVLADKEVEMPSDLAGIVYTDTCNWQFSLLKELKAMGYSIDYNKID